MGRTSLSAPRNDFKNSPYKCDLNKNPDCVEVSASAQAMRRSKKESINLEILKVGLIVKIEFFSDAKILGDYEYCFQG